MARLRGRRGGQHRWDPGTARNRRQGPVRRRPDAELAQPVGDGGRDLELAAGVGVRAVVGRPRARRSRQSASARTTRDAGVLRSATSRADQVVVGTRLRLVRGRGSVASTMSSPGSADAGARDEPGQQVRGVLGRGPGGQVVVAEHRDQHVGLVLRDQRRDGYVERGELHAPAGCVVAVEGRVHVVLVAEGVPDLVAQVGAVADEVDLHVVLRQVVPQPVAPRPVTRGALRHRVAEQEDAHRRVGRCGCPGDDGDRQRGRDEGADQRPAPPPRTGHARMMTQRPRCSWILNRTGREAGPLTPSVTAVTRTA